MKYDSGVSTSLIDQSFISKVLNNFVEVSSEGAIIHWLGRISIHSSKYEALAIGLYYVYQLGKPFLNEGKALPSILRFLKFIGVIVCGTDFN